MTAYASYQLLGQEALFIAVCIVVAIVVAAVPGLVGLKRKKVPKPGTAREVVEAIATTAPALRMTDSEKARAEKLILEYVERVAAPLREEIGDLREILEERK